MHVRMVGSDAFSRCVSGNPIDGGETTLESNTIPMSRWLDSRQITRIRTGIASLAAEAGWFAADVLHRLEQAAPGTAALFGASMADQRRALVEGLAWLDDIDRADTMRARLAALDRTLLAPWAAATRHVDALARAVCEALAAMPGLAFDEDDLAAWQALRVHVTLLLLDTDRARAAA
jgi:hypothetical protein